MIVKCSCKHEAQDRLHGPGKRVANPLRPRSPGDTPLYRCTVCKKEVQAQAQDQGPSKGSE